jgi:hypothetical protein
MFVAQAYACNASNSATWLAVLQVTLVIAVICYFTIQE